MNYFAHGRAFVDDSYFLAGTAVPDWLNVVDRLVRVRSKRAEPWTDCDDPRVARVAAGIVRHHADDAWFHETRAFAELSLEIGRQLRTVLPRDDGFRPYFLAHILVEILLDAALIADDPDRLQAYYQALETLDGAVVERAVNCMAATGTVQLAGFIRLFSRERFLSDYADDAKLFVRLNQVMRRVCLPALPETIGDVLPDARRQVAERKAELLTPGPAKIAQPI